MAGIIPMNAMTGDVVDQYTQSKLSAYEDIKALGHGHYGCGIANTNKAIALTGIVDADDRDESIAYALRIATCFNACAGIPTEKLVGKTIAEYVVNEAYLTGISDGQMGLEGLGAQMVASNLTGLFVGSDAVNYVELNFAHSAIGSLTMTLQRNDGKTPHMFRQEAEQQRDELLKALKDIAKAGQLTAVQSAMAQDVISKTELNLGG
jgi:hypothetical protein